MIRSMFSEGLSRTYKTPENAIKRLDEVLGTHEETFRFCVIAVESNGSIRYAPLVVLNRDQQHYCGGLAHAGICVTF